MTPRHLLSIGDLSRDELVTLLDRADALRQGAAPRDSLPRKVAALAFFQSSTRTRVGFAAAISRLGHSFVELGTVRHDTGMTAAEPLEDTLRVVSGYVDMVVLRHPDLAVSRSAVLASRCPVINAGIGDWEHPTQALADLYAVRTKLGRLTGLRWGLVGDLGSSRAAHSLVRALKGLDPAEVRLMSPEGAQLDSGWLAGWAPGVIRQVMSLEPSGLDALYFAGLPPGRRQLDAAARREFALTLERAVSLPERCLVMCPLPRIDEIDRAFDSDSRAVYFDQSDMALFARQALIEWALAPSPAPD